MEKPAKCHQALFHDSVCGPEYKAMYILGPMYWWTSSPTKGPYRVCSTFTLLR